MTRFTLSNTKGISESDLEILNQAFNLVILRFNEEFEIENTPELLESLADELFDTWSEDDTENNVELLAERVIDLY